MLQKVKNDKTLLVNAIFFNFGHQRILKNVSGFNIDNNKCLLIENQHTIMIYKQGGAVLPLICSRVPEGFWIYNKLENRTIEKANPNTL